MFLVVIVNPIWLGAWSNYVYVGIVYPIWLPDPIIFLVGIVYPIRLPDPIMFLVGIVNPIWLGAWSNYVFGGDCKSNMTIRSNYQLCFLISC